MTYVIFWIFNVKMSSYSNKGAIIFYREGGPSVCDGRSAFFSGPPFAYGKKFWSPLCLRRKILVPPFDLVKKFWSPPPKVEEHSPRLYQ